MTGSTYRLKPNAMELGGRAMQTIAVPLLLGSAFAYLLYLYPPPSMEFTLAGGVSIVAVLALAIVRYEAAVAIGFLLLGVVFVEPAPPDIVFALIMVVALVTGRFDISRAPLLITILIIIVLASNLLSTIEATDANRAALFFSITAYLVIFALWLTGFVSSVSRARVVVLGYLTAASISALLGVLALLVPFPGSDVFLTQGRAKALFHDPNVYGPFLIPAALIILQETLEPRLLRVGRSFKLALFLLLTVGVLVSFSRGAFVNLGVALVVMFLVILLRQGGVRQVPGMLVIVGIAAIGVLGALQLGQTSDFLEQRSTLQTYDADRFAAQRRGVELAFEYPVGVGPGQSEVVDPIASHSIYVRALSEQGVVGLFALGGLMLTTLLLATRNALVGRSAFGIGSAALLGAWCGILVNSFVIDSLHWRHLWVIAALIWVASMRRPEPYAVER